MHYITGLERNLNLRLATWLSCLDSQCLSCWTSRPTFKSKKSVSFQLSSFLANIVAIKHFPVLEHRTKNLPFYLLVYFSVNFYVFEFSCIEKKAKIYLIISNYNQFDFTGFWGFGVLGFWLWLLVFGFCFRFLVWFWV